MIVRRVHRCHLSSTRVRPLQSLSSSDIIFEGQSINQFMTVALQSLQHQTNIKGRPSKGFSFFFAEPVHHGAVLAIYRSFKGRAALETDLSPSHKLIYVLSYTFLPFVPCHRGVPVIANHTLCLSNVWSSI